METWLGWFDSSNPDHVVIVSQAVRVSGCDPGCKGLNPFDHTKKVIMQFYYAIFTKGKESIQVSFPNIPGVETFGIDLTDAYKTAEEVLHEYTAQKFKFPETPLTFDDIREQILEDECLILLVPIRVTTWEEAEEDGPVLWN